MSTSDPSSIVATATAVVALTSAVSIGVLQTDAVGRRVLDPSTLSRRRHATYAHRHTVALDTSHVQVQAYRNSQKQLTGIAGAAGDPTTAVNDREDSIVVSTDTGLATLIANWMKTKPSVTVGPIDRPTRSNITTDTNNNTIDTNEHYLRLYCRDRDDPNSDATTTATNNSKSTDTVCIVVYDVPLIRFGTALADALDRTLVRTGALVFVHDAVTSTCGADGGSSGGANAVVDLVRAAGGIVEEASSSSSRTTSSNTTSVVGAVTSVQHRPLWMMQWTVLAQQRVYAASKLQQCVSALCRLPLLSHPRSATLLYTCAAAWIPVLLPALHQAFPDDRHVFVYTGCGPTIQCALAAKSSKSSSSSSTTKPTSLGDAMSMPFVPMAPLSASFLQQSLAVTDQLPTRLAAVPLEVAAVTETWMAAVDALLHYQEVAAMNVRTKVSGAAEFVPYVCRLDYLAFHDTNDDPAVVESSALHSKQYWACRSLVQYVTGSRSREISSECMDAAISWARDAPILQQLAHLTSTTATAMSKNSYTSMEYWPPLSPSISSALDRIVFEHKLILLPHKTLLDTVAPAQHWSLKQAVRGGGCACCDPEDEDDNGDEGDSMIKLRSNNNEDDNGDDEEDGMDNGIASRAKNRYVDGKMGFAFDPGKFS